MWFPRSFLISSPSDSIRFYNIQDQDYCLIRCYAVRTLSDEKAKVNIRALDSGLEAVKSLVSGISGGNDTKKRVRSTEADSDHFIEALKARFPDLVSEAGDGTVLVNYIELIPLVTNAVNELRATVIRQQEEISSLQSTMTKTDTGI